MGGVSGVPGVNGNVAMGLVHDIFSACFASLWPVPFFYTSLFCCSHNNSATFLCSCFELGISNFSGSSRTIAFSVF